MRIQTTTLLLLGFFCMTYPNHRIEAKWIRKVGKAFKKVGDVFRKGCCGVHPSVCKMRNEFKQRQTDIKAKAAIIDRSWIKGMQTNFTSLINMALDI